MSLEIPNLSQRLHRFYQLFFGHRLYDKVNSSIFYFQRPPLILLYILLICVPSYTSYYHSWIDGWIILELNLFSPCNLLFGNLTISLCSVSRISQCSSISLVPLSRSCINFRSSCNISSFSLLTLCCDSVYSLLYYFCNMSVTSLPFTSFFDWKCSPTSFVSACLTAILLHDTELFFDSLTGPTTH